MNYSGKTVTRVNRERTGQGSQMEEEDEDEESSSSSLAIPPIAYDLEKQENPDNANVEGRLDNFRQQWKKEVKVNKEERQEENSSFESLNVNDGENASLKEVATKKVECDIEKKARELFLEGVEHEENGRLYEAILQYKKALHLVPDIEFKVFNFMKEKGSNANSTINSSSYKVGNTKSSEDFKTSEMLSNEEKALELDLLSRFSKLSIQHQYLCEPEIPTMDGHISKLPMEVIINILKWVVSSELDTSSLESCSNVCRGFYLASRTSDIWRQLSLKTWGIESFDALSSTVKSNIKNSGENWRDYFITNPRVHLNGCYIAKISYMREGERGFQDHELYKAWHMIQYYRLIRFFPGGKIVMATIADEPAQAVKIFNNMEHGGIPDSMTGCYRTVHDHVICVVKKNNHSTNLTNNVLKYQRSAKSKAAIQYVFEVPDQVFHFEMQIKGKNFNQLHWLNYAVASRYKSTGKSQQTEFDVKDIYSYPPLHFSRVKSYRQTESTSSL